MKTKMTSLLIVTLLVSFSALCQTTDSSSHPKLDAFRKLKQNSRQTTVVEPASGSPATTNIDNNTATPAGASAGTDNNATPTGNSSSNTSKTLPAPNNEVTATPKDNTPSQASPTANSNTTSGSSTTSANQNQNPQQAQTPAEEKSIFFDSRLGSSTKQYDTYKKNNNGAGAVTTSPK